MRKPLYFVLSILTLILPAACSQKKSESAQPKTIVTTGIPPLTAIVEQIGGDSVEVNCLMPDGADPESFDPGVQALRRASDSHVYFAIGTLPYEDELTKNLRANNPGLEVVNLAETVDAIYGTHGDEADPHIWMSLPNIAAMADKICDILSAENPRSAEYFAKRRDAYKARLDSVNRDYTSRLVPYKERSIVVGHPSLSYFARDYGMNQVSLETGHKESSVLSKKQRLDEARQSKPTAVFVQPGAEGRMAAEAAPSLGLSPVDINPMDPDTEKQLGIIVNAITSAQ